MNNIDHIDDKIRLGTLIRRRRNQLPGLKDFAWHTKRICQGPFTTPWRSAEVIRQVENFVQGKPCHPTTIALLEVDKDHEWRICHIDKDLLAELPDEVEDEYPVEFVELKEDSYYEPLHYWLDTHH